MVAKRDGDHFVGLAQQVTSEPSIVAVSSVMKPKHLHDEHRQRFAMAGRRHGVAAKFRKQAHAAEIDGYTHS